MEPRQQNYQRRRADQLAQQAGYKTAALPAQSAHTLVLVVREAPI